MYVIFSAFLQGIIHLWSTPASDSAHLLCYSAQLQWAAQSTIPSVRSRIISGDNWFSFLPYRYTGDNTWKSPQSVSCAWCLSPGYQNITSFGASFPDGDIINITYVIHFIGDEFTVPEALKERKWLSYCIWNLHLVSFEVFE